MTATTNSNTNPIVFFDGVCNLCNASVDFLIQRDKRHLLRFAPLSGKTAAALLAQKTIPDSIVLYIDGQIFTRSTAALKLVRFLPWPWQILRVGWLLPSFLRNALYDFIARHRYRWFGKKETCRLPTPAEKALFLE
ncbi:MAG TPA: thiol-disulfide oxidoreductase DCC family protein [Turneriella sp.]|nr:thiol-disulfide oxidoreductase DCC family protein [Turneriella sp.]